MVFIYVSVIFWIGEIFFDSSEFNNSLIFYLIFLSALFLIYIPIILFQIKHVEVYKNRIVLKRAILRTESAIRFEDIEYITERNFGFHYGLDYLLIQGRGSNLRIFCIYVHNYKKLKQIILYLYEKQRL
ncbi:hypothetical protein DENIS_0908 [Desulfonema ishimotonii]|uniref:Uncharacterized protein n=1 Tax=Desulfonema ishimotonii TaxID=45657 RepID=A0A401FSN3_9BACT|nr:hypothetical protein DENIS_0908 [Desulfonema ishimotonii]